MDAHDPQETQQQESRAKGTAEEQISQTARKCPRKICFALTGIQAYHVQ